MPIARLSFVYKNRYRNNSRAHKRHGIARIVSFITNLFLEFISMILKPYFDLGRREIYESCELFALWGGEVSLLSKTPLQLEDLRLGEKHSSFSLFSVWNFHFLVVVVFVAEILRVKPFCGIS